MLAIGIGMYFKIRVEPPLWALGVACLGGLLGLFAARFMHRLRIFVHAGALIALGFGMAGLRAHHVAGPVLDFRYYGAIEGRIVTIDRSASDALRLTLDRVVLERMDPAETPLRVRVSLHGQQGYIDPKPGMTIILTGHLGAPGGAVEPGGFDFKRHAWFLRLGAVGYTRTPVLMLEPSGRALPVERARKWLSARVTAALPGETGAFAAAIMSGDRSEMGQVTLNNLRDTNLAHLLAISGLHMGLLAGFVFSALRLGLLFAPHARHHWPVKKLAAIGALIASAGYLALSGGNIATQRAFVMVATALCAMLLDRRALSLRSVAMAALIVLTLRPEALLGPGFQMSFAATVALVAVFERLGALRGTGSTWLSGVLSVVVSSAVAGAATAPVGMAHFNRVAVFGLLANLVSVPVMGALVVPLGVLSVTLMPLGLDWIALKIMGLGLDWILFVARWVAAWPGATRPIVAPPGAVLPLIAFGGLILCLWRGRGKLVGLLPVLLGLLLWNSVARPEILIADNGALVGIMTEHGRALSRESGSGFIADNWLENDGQTGGQQAAAARWPGETVGRIASAQIAGTFITHLQGTRAAEGFTRCQRGEIVVSSVDLALDGPCEVFDPRRLSTTGSVAITLTGGGAQMTTAAEVSGRRLWHGY
jgi:competence protein ComEC